MGQISKSQSISVIIISILIAALIVRIIYVIFDSIGVLVEEIYDDDNEYPFDRSLYYWINAILVTLLCIVALIIIYEGYVIDYIGQIPEDNQILDNPHPVIIAAAAVGASQTPGHGSSIGSADGHL